MSTKRTAENSLEDGRPTKRQVTDSPEEGELDDGSSAPPNSLSPLQSITKYETKIKFPFKKKSIISESRPEADNGMRPRGIYERSDEDDRRWRERERSYSSRLPPARHDPRIGNSGAGDRWNPAARRYDRPRAHYDSDRDREYHSHSRGNRWPPGAPLMSPRRDASPRHERDITPRRERSRERRPVSRSPSSPRSRSPHSPESSGREKHRLPPPRPVSPPRYSRIYAPSRDRDRDRWHSPASYDRDIDRGRHYRPQLDSRDREREQQKYEEDRYGDIRRPLSPVEAIQELTSPVSHQLVSPVTVRPISPSSSLRQTQPLPDGPITPPRPADRTKPPPPVDVPPPPPPTYIDSTLPVKHASIIIPLSVKRPPTPVDSGSPHPPTQPSIKNEQAPNVQAGDVKVGINGHGKMSSLPSLQSRSNNGTDSKGVVQRYKRKPVHRSREEEERIYGRTFIGCGKQEDYDVLTKLGEGTFGEVHKAVHHTGQHVALKRILMHNEKEGMPVTALREIKILKALRHSCIVDILDMFVVKSKGKDSPLSVYMVFPYMDHDLAGLLENERVKLSPSQIKLYMKQLLEGTEYMHRNHILHRDMKAANLLISNTGCLKIADFGLARAFDPAVISGKEDQRKYTNCVVTRWYRPPELLLGARQYGGEVDMWGIGCVLGEMFWRRPILPGSSDLDQLDRIWQLCGTPNQHSWPNYDTLPGCDGVKRFQMYPRRLKAAYESIGPETCDLLDKLLICNPRDRLTASQALDHDYFWTDPLPADPKTLPSYEASHEFDKRGRRQQPPEGPPVHLSNMDGPPRPLPMPTSQAPFYNRGPPPRESFRQGPHPPHFAHAHNGFAPPPGHGPPLSSFPPPHPGGSHQGYPPASNQGYLHGPGQGYPPGPGQGYPLGPPQGYPSGPPGPPFPHSQGPHHGYAPGPNQGHHYHSQRPPYPGPGPQPSTLPPISIRPGQPLPMWNGASNLPFRPPVQRGGFQNREPPRHPGYGGPGGGSNDLNYG